MEPHHPTPLLFVYASGLTGLARRGLDAVNAQSVRATASVSGPSRTRTTPLYTTSPTAATAARLPSTSRSLDGMGEGPLALPDVSADAPGVSDLPPDVVPVTDAGSDSDGVAEESERGAVSPSTSPSTTDPPKMQTPPTRPTVPAILEPPKRPVAASRAPEANGRMQPGQNKNDARSDVELVGPELRKGPSTRRNAPQLSADGSNRVPGTPAGRHWERKTTYSPRNASDHSPRSQGDRSSVANARFDSNRGAQKRRRAPDFGEVSQSSSRGHTRTSGSDLDLSLRTQADRIMRAAAAAVRAARAYRTNNPYALPNKDQNDPSDGTGEPERAATPDLDASETKDDTDAPSEMDTSSPVPTVASSAAKADTEGDVGQRSVNDVAGVAEANPALAHPSMSIEDVVLMTEEEETSEVLRLKGREVERLLNPKLARELFSASTDLNPQNGKAWQDLSKVVGRIHSSLRRSVAVLFSALDVNPENAYLWQSIGFLHFRMGQCERAREMFESGLRCDPLHAPIYSTWGRMEDSLNDVATARELFERGAKADPQCARLYYTWGTMELRLGNVGRAHELFARGLEADPGNPHIWQTLGALSVEKGELDAARKCFRKALVSDPDNVVVLDHWGRLEARSSNWQQARELFHRGAKNSPYDARVLQSWARMEMQQGRLDAAHTLMRRAVRISARDSLLWSLFARIEYERGDIPRARALFKRATDTNARDWMSWDRWSAMEDQLGNADVSAKLLQRSFAIRFQAKGEFTVLANTIPDDRPKF